MECQSLLLHVMSLFKSLNPNMLGTKALSCEIYSFFYPMHKHVNRKNTGQIAAFLYSVHTAALCEVLFCVDEHAWGLIKAIHETNSIPHTAHYGIEINLWNVTSGLLESKRERGARRKSAGGFSSDNTHHCPALCPPHRGDKSKHSTLTHTCLKGRALIITQKSKTHTHWQKAPASAE